jgi:DNA-binding transcriptional MocR family regulator
VAARGVDLEPSASAFVGTPSLRGFRVSYAFHPEERLRTALTILAEELRRLG